MNALALANVPHFVISNETEHHDDAIAQLHQRAFGPGRHTRAASIIRESSPIVTALNAVCEDAFTGVLLGSVRQAPLLIGKREGVLLGPLAVDPLVKGMGIGRALLREAIGRADSFGAEFIVLVGDAPYYAPSGFKPTQIGTVQFPIPVDPTRILFYDLSEKGQPFGLVRPHQTKR